MKHKKGLVAILATLMLVCTGIAFTSCSQQEKDPNENVETEKPFVATLPTIADVSADLVDRPVAISTNGCDLRKVYVNGEELPDTHYLTRNGKFILAYETYGDELAVGEYAVKLSFAQGDATYTIKLVDEAKPVCSLDTENAKSSYVKGEALQFPLVVRLNDYQKYDSEYTVYNAKGEIVETYKNVEKSEEPIVWEDVDSYTLKIRLTRKDQEVAAFDDWKFEVQPFEGASVFKAANIGAHGWMVGEAKNTAISYNEEEKALQFANLVNNGMRSDQSVASYPIATLAKAKTAGYEALSFYVKANETLTNTAWWDLPTAENKAAWNSASSAGLRIFGATKRVDLANKIRHDYVVWENDSNYINRGNQGDGVYVYKDLYATELSSTEYTQVVIDIDEFLSLGEDLQYMSFVIGGVKGSILSVKETQWLTQEELDAYQNAKIATDKEAYAKKNYASENMLYRYGVHKNSAYITRGYDEENGAIKATVNTAGGHSKAQTNIFALGALDIRYAYEKLGFTHLTVTWKANKEMLNPASATTGTGRCVRLYTSVVNTTPSGSEINLPDLGVEWTSFKIDLKVLIEEKNANYLCFVIGGELNDSVWFKDIALSVEK